MLNNVVLVGRLTKNVEKKEIENGKETAIIILAVPRNFKNADGEYETDFISCKLWNPIASNVVKYCKKGDIIGVKGRLQTQATTNDEGFQNGYELQIIAEKVTFLSNNSEKINKEINNENN